MIVEKREAYGNNIQHEWCRIDFDLALGTGEWEWMVDEDDSESYCSGLLWLDGKILVDYDGVAELPDMVVSVLKENGIDCSEI